MRTSPNFSPIISEKNTKDGLAGPINEEFCQCNEGRI